MSTKSRKKYKHDPGRKWEHPMLKKAEAAGLERWRVKHFELMDSYQEGEPRTQMIVTQIAKAVFWARQITAKTAMEAA